MISKLLLSTLLLSTIAQADPATTTLSIGNITFKGVQTVTLSNLHIDAKKIVVTKTDDEFVKVDIAVLGSSESSVGNFQVATAVSNLDLTVRDSSSYYSCSYQKINGVYTSVHGTCVLAVTVSLPQNFTGKVFAESTLIYGEMSVSDVKVAFSTVHFKDEKLKIVRDFAAKNPRQKLFTCADLAPMFKELTFDGNDLAHAVTGMVKDPENVSALVATIDGFFNNKALITTLLSAR
jgi:hypothetical protein